jgi:protein involved in polysaccharide export with SLBB domain
MPSKVHDRGWFLNPRLLAALLALLLAATSARADLIPETPAPSSGGGGVSALPMPDVTVSSTYELSPYDVIDVSVYGEEDLHTRARLGADGTVLLPLIGNVSLSGKTVTEANDLIKKRYADGGYVKDPHVLLMVVEYRKSTFSILGQVNRPGIYEIPEGSHMSIVDAILLAGGFTRIAEQNGVRVKRTVKGKSTVFKVKAGAMADHDNVAPFEIKPGDVIKVPESWW